MIYLTDPQTRASDRQKVTELLAGKEGVAGLIGPDRYAALGLPSPDKNSGMADLIVVAKGGYAIVGTAVGEAFLVPVSGTVNLGYHGYLASNPDMDAAFLVSGRGIKQNVKIGPVENIDIAPTIAHLLGHELPDAEGHLLTEILR